MTLTARSLAAPLAALLLLGAPAVAAQEGIAQGFDAESLRIENFVGALRVLPEPGHDEIRVEATESQWGWLQARQSGDVLHLVADRPGRGLFDFAFEDEPPVTVVLPAGAALRLELTAGTAEIGDLSGPLELEARAGKVTIGSAGPASLRVFGAASVEVGQATGDVAILLDGSGSVTVEQADAEHLEVAVRGLGRVEVGGEAESADLSLIGLGRIRVERVAQPPSVRIDGLGSIDVGNRP